MKNKLCAVILLLCMTAALSGCGQSSTTSGSDSSVGSVSNKPDTNTVGQVLTTLERFFQYGPVCVQSPNGLWGYVDENGNYVIEPKYPDASSFSKAGLAAVQDPDSYLYGFIDASGRYIIEPQYISARGFAQDRSAVMNQDYMMGYIDTSGAYVIEPQYYDQDSSFSGDRAFVHFAAAGSFDGGWALIDLNGNQLTDPIFEKGDSAYWYDGICRIQRQGETGYIFINKQGEVVAPRDGGSFLNAGFFGDGLCYVQDYISNLYGYIDLNGNWAIQPCFGEAGRFSADCAMARDMESGLWGIIDLDGNWITEPQFVERPMGDSYGKFIIRNDTSYLLIDQYGSVIHEYNFPNAVQCSIYGDTLSVCLRDSEEMPFGYQLYDLDGNPKGNWRFTTYKSVVSSSTGMTYAVVKYDDLWGVIDGDGNWLISANYLDIKI